MNPFDPQIRPVPVSHSPRAGSGAGWQIITGTLLAVTLLGLVFAAGRWSVRGEAGHEPAPVLTRVAAPPATPIAVIDPPIPGVAPEAVTSQSPAPSGASELPTFRSSVEPVLREEPADGAGLPDLSVAEASAERDAMSKYRSLRLPDTLMSQLYHAHAEDWRARHDPMLKSPGWPALLAEQCAGEVVAYLQPDLLSPNGEFRLLPEETFAGYHVRRQVLARFNEEVVASADRNITRYPDADRPETPLAKKLSALGDALRENEPSFFETPDWPERLTARCLKENSQFNPKAEAVQFR